MLSMTRGDGLTESWMYNNRLQPSTITVGTSGSVFGATLYYYPNKTAACVTNNGNLLAQTLTVNNVDQSFSYDHLNRISTRRKASVRTRIMGMTPMETDGSAAAQVWVGIRLRQLLRPTLTQKSVANSEFGLR